MRKLVIIFTASLFFVLSANAQYKWDLGVKVGGSNYLGDIGGQEMTRRDFIWDMKLDQTKMNYAFFARYKASKTFAVAANLDYISIYGYDANSTNPARRARNLNFRNRIYEVGLRGELTVFYDNDVGGRGYYNPDYRFYLFAGIAGFKHNPEGQIYAAVDPEGTEIPFNYGGEWVDLRPFRTENQTEEYKSYGLAIPAGLGMNFTFYKQWRLGWELNWRTTFTDYIDDVSTAYGDIDDIASRGGAAYAQQSNQYVINAINNDPSVDGGNMHINSHQWQGYSADDPTVPIYTKRGDLTNTDSYLTMAFTGSYVIKGSSSFYRSKYSWLKQRRGTRRSRAKF